MKNKESVAASPAAGRIMRALTLTQPWATLVAIRAKRIETRSWATGYRGPLAIHAAKGFPLWAREFTDCRLVNGLLVNAGYATADRHCGLPIGSVIATCRLVDCVPTALPGSMRGYQPRRASRWCTTVPRNQKPVFALYPELESQQERDFGDYYVGRWAWVLEDVKALPVPIPAKGSLGLWTVVLPATDAAADD